MLSFFRKAVVFLFLPALVSAALYGCKSDEVSDRHILEGVPSDARFIVSANIEKIMKNAGCRFRDNGEIILSDDIKRLLFDGEEDPMLTRLNEVAPLIDLSYVVCFGKDTDKPVVTFAIADRDRFDEYLSEKCEPEEVDGLTVYEDGGNAIVTDGAQGWAGDRRTVLASISDAAENHAGIYSGVVNYLDDKQHTVSAVVNVNDYRKAENGSWGAMSINLGENVLGYEILAMDDDGLRESFTDYIDLLDTDFLRYVPGNSCLVAAVGRIHNLDKLAQLLALVPDAGFAQMAAVALPYLKEIDGTTAVAVNPAASAENLKQNMLGAWDVTAITHLPQETTDNLLSTGMLYARAGGMNVKNTDNGFSFRIDNDVNVSVETHDGYLMASTREISGDCSNSFTQVFEGKRGGLVIDIPVNSEPAKAFGLPYGIYFSFEVDDDAMTGRFRFAGSDLPLLATAIKCLER